MKSGTGPNDGLSGPFGASGYQSAPNRGATSSRALNTLPWIGSRVMKTWTVQRIRIMSPASAAEDDQVAPNKINAQM